MNTTVHSLYQTQREKKKRQNEVYKKFLETCHGRIQMRNAMGFTSMSYQVPPFVIGYSIYNHENAIKYVKVKLRQGGFHVRVEGCTIYIDWGMRTKQKKERSSDSNDSSRH